MLKKESCIYAGSGVSQTPNAYTVRGARSGCYYHINLQPNKNYVRVNIYCKNSSYNYFNVLANFNYEKNADFVRYAG